ncbi:Altered inheritance of mitochondria protein 11 [Nakaseomyces bracarensis]|uniref:Altered inheritance of mitochondria protein 11 n=1 Tax=Nakaseomyces bracarensis TaxID=273131 RepID=A0ABR4NVW3_9SACH
MDASSTNSSGSRRTQQLLLLLGSTAYTFAIARITTRSIAMRKYVPKFFQLNTRIAPFSGKSEAQSALTLSTGLSTGLFAMTITGFCWVMDISSPKEFTEKMKLLLGAKKPNKVIVQDNDPETEEIIKQLQDLVNRK